MSMAEQHELSSSESDPFTESYTASLTEREDNEDLYQPSMYQRFPDDQEDESQSADEEEGAEQELEDGEAEGDENMIAVARGPLLGPQSDVDRGRLTVVLDMDETLIHSNFIDPEDVALYADCKATSDAFLEGVEPDRGVAVNIRPHLKEFLREVGKHFEPVVFTAANEEYASAVLDWVDPEKHIRARLYRESTSDCQCVFFFPIPSFVVVFVVVFVAVFLVCCSCVLFARDHDLSNLVQFMSFTSLLYMVMVGV
jgi:hypothetical protein